MKKIFEEDMGHTVICDACNEDYTGKPDVGGFLFGSYAYCPKCAKRALPTIKFYKEERFIKAYCPEDKSFAVWVVELRAGDNRFLIYGED